MLRRLPKKSCPYSGRERV